MADEVDAAFGVGQAPPARPVPNMLETAMIYDIAGRLGLGWAISELAHYALDQGWKGDYRAIVTVLNHVEHLKPIAK